MDPSILNGDQRTNKAISKKGSKAVAVINGKSYVNNFWEARGTRFIDSLRKTNNHGEIYTELLYRLND